MVEDPEPTEISSIEQINQEILQEFLAKTSVWDFYEIAKGEYMNKSNDEKKSLIIQYFNCMTSGIFFYLLFGICSLFLMSVIWIVSLLMTRLSPVSSLPGSFCST